MTNTQKSKLPVILGVALAIAIIAMIVLFVQQNNLSKQNETLTADLAESQANWQTVSAEKEALEGELATVNGNLREAETALGESMLKIDELDGQVNALTVERDTLQLELNAAVIAQDEMNAYIATTTDLLATTTDLLVVTTAERDAALAENADLKQQLEDANAMVANASGDLHAARQMQLDSLVLLRAHLQHSEAEMNKQLAKSNLTEAARDGIRASIASIKDQIAELDVRIAEVEALLAEE